MQYFLPARLRRRDMSQRPSIVYLDNADVVKAALLPRESSSEKCDYFSRAFAGGLLLASRISTERSGSLSCASTAASLSAYGPEKIGHDFRMRIACNARSRVARSALSAPYPSRLLVRQHVAETDVTGESTIFSTPYLRHGNTIKMAQ